MKNTPLHVGSLVRAELYKQDQTVSWLAQQLGIKRTNCYRILHAQSIHTSLMEQLSIAIPTEHPPHTQHCARRWKFRKEKHNP